MTRARLCWWRAGLWHGSIPRDGTIFVTIEDETGDAQAILWPDVYARYKRELGSQVVLMRGELSRYDGTANVIVSEVRALRSGVRMPEAHNWR